MSDNDLPADPISGARPGGGDAAEDAGGAGRGGGARFYELGRQLRAIREEINQLRDGDLERIRRQVDNRLGDLRIELREEVRAGLGTANNELAELLPRVAELEDTVARIRREVALGATPRPNTDPNPGNAAGPAAPGVDGGAVDPEADDLAEVPLTPSIGWDQMGRADAERAWAALAEFVERVLHRQYRFSRLQLPDCWPLHPRMVRELAWLRSTYHDAGVLEPAEPGAAMSWHIRYVPGFLINTNEAVDVRECRPGIHRLTESEVSDYEDRRGNAQKEGKPPPPLTRETGHDRPQLIPAHFPRRVVSSITASRDGEHGPKPPTPDELPELIVGACHPDYWHDHYLAASAADLRERP